MKDAGIFITVGTRDLQLNQEVSGLELFYSPESKTYSIKNPRSIGSYLTSRERKFPDVGEFEYPIIKPAFNFIREQGFNIKWVKLVVTNQVDAVEEYKKNDTYFYPLILEQLIRRDFKGILDEQIDFVPLSIERNIIFLDSMYEFFNKYFSENDQYKAYADTDKVFFLGQGGVDALNTGLLLNLIEFFPNLIQLQKSAGVDHALPLKFTDLFRSGFRKKLYENSINQALKQYNYSLIKEIVNKKTSEFYLSSYALARNHLDFNLARKSLMELMKIDLNNRDTYTVWYQELAPESNQNVIQRELFFSAMIHFYQGAYSDYLWRLFTLEENLLKPILEIKLGGKIEYDSSSKHASWLNLINANMELKQYLEKPITGANFKLDFKTPNRIVFRYVYNYFFPEDHPERPAGITGILEGLTTLSKLRNDLAHSMTGVSLEEINRKLNGRAEDLNALLFDYFDVGNNTLPPYDEVNAFMQKLLKA